ncbi:hypothetical protein Scel_09570 [Streptomyces cellostaticus]|nr:hypothetical protein Scel_09570 [Streptomyces cellostaticus]
MCQARRGATVAPGTAIDDMGAALPVSEGGAETAAARTGRDHRTDGDDLRPGLSVPWDPAWGAP